MLPKVFEQVWQRYWSSISPFSVKQAVSIAEIQIEKRV